MYFVSVYYWLSLYGHLHLVTRSTRQFEARGVVVLGSRGVGGRGPEGRRSGLGWGLCAGCGLGRGIEDGRDGLGGGHRDLLRLLLLLLCTVASVTGGLGGLCLEGRAPELGSLTLALERRGQAAGSGRGPA